MEFIRIEHPYLGQFTSSFAIKDADRCVFVDTGLRSGYEKLRAVCPRPDAILSTHGHWDHTGCHRLFQREGVPVLVGEEDLPICREMSLQWKQMYADYQNDFSIPPERRTVFDTEASDNFAPEPITHWANTLAAGGEDFMVMTIPGHTKGSLLLQHSASGVTYTGDTVCGKGFFGVVPQIEDFAEYVSTLNRLKNVEVDIAYAAHMTEGMSNAVFHQMLEDGLARCEELRELAASFFKARTGSYRIGQMADSLCERLNQKTKNSGLCVTCRAIIQSFADEYDAVSRCLNKI